MARTWLTIVGVTLVIGIAACVSPSVTSSPMTDGPAESASLDPPTTAELEAIRFRTTFGLRADLAYVRAVAIDPGANTAFGVPLLPAEAEELAARSSNADAILGIVRAEAAAAPADYCGVYLDNQNAGAVTSMWRANRVIHELAIRSQISPIARVVFVACRFSEAELNQVVEALSAADRGWMRTIPAEATGWGTNTMLNRIEMDISSAVPDAADRVVRHYTDLLSLQTGIFAVISDGTGTALRPWGTVLITVLRPDGKPVGSNNFDVRWESLNLAGTGCGSGVGVGIPENGEPAELPCQEGTWRILITGEGGAENVLGEGQVVVRAGETTKLTIRLERLQ